MTDDAAARTDSAGTLHACDVTRGCLALGGYDPNALSMKCGCRVLVHRFKCPGCQRFVGWCMGSHDELGDFCDGCWDDARKAWDALRAPARALLVRLGECAKVDLVRGTPAEFLLPQGQHAWRPPGCEESRPVRELQRLRRRGLVTHRTERRGRRDYLTYVRVLPLGARARQIGIAEEDRTR